MYDNLFSPIKIRGLTLRNRIVMPAMGTHFSDENCFVTQQLIDYSVARALGGSGLNYMECCAINAQSSPAKQPSIAEDKFMPGHRAFTRAIHTAGGKCAMQLWQGGAGAGVDPKCRMFIPDFFDGKNSPIFIPPWGRHEPDGTVPAVTAEELRMLVEDYGRAAARSVACGYDALEFHCGHNYLPHTMLSKAFNHRTDEYGGSLENRMRFPLDCIRAIRANMPEDMPLFMRISVVDESDLDGGKGGNTIEENIEFCKRAKLEGVDVINVSRGNFSGFGNVYEVPPLNFPCGFNVDNAARVRRETGLVTMAVGRINTPELAEKILAEDKADLICMGRAQLADAEFVNKCRDGRTDEIRYCIGCNQGCNDGFTDLPHITCLRNPFLGREREMAIEPAAKPKKVLVVGGGMGGMECALYLKARGHEPVIIDMADHLGGQFILAGMAPQKHEFIKAVNDEIEFVRKADIPVRLNTKATPELIAELRPDEVVVATGAGPLLIPIPGADLPNVSNAHAVLREEAKPTGHVVIIGGGIVGVEIAEFLLSKNCRCSIIEMKDSVASDLGFYRRVLSLKAFEEEGVECIVNAACKEITPSSVKYQKDGKLCEISCDSVVIAAGAKSLPHDDITAACDKLSIPYHVIGDAQKARRALNAVAEGVAAALEI
jgi:2,4-dienoyl-CoA reductase-like NADH-dependent reductase (Old Yellow Enzyme family)/thioredoxin reductase